MHKRAANFSASRFPYKSQEFQAERNVRSHLYLHSFVQRSVHQSVERQEEGADGVEEGVAIFAVPVEPDGQRRMGEFSSGPRGWCRWRLWYLR